MTTSKFKILKDFVHSGEKTHPLSQNLRKFKAFFELKQRPNFENLIYQKMPRKILTTEDQMLRELIQKLSLDSGDKSLALIIAYF